MRANGARNERREATLVINAGSKGSVFVGLCAEEKLSHGLANSQAVPAFNVNTVFT